jgi:nucleoid-associated protein YgaU
MNKNQYQFTSDTGLSVVVYRDEAAPYIASGYGGWTTVSRMRRTALTQFTGPDPVRLAVPILFDGFMAGTPQESNISTLERMARPAVPGADPPTVRIDGGIPRKDITRWVIESIDYSGQSKVIWDIIGGVTVRLRQDAVVNMLQYVSADLVALQSGPNVGFGPGGTSLANRRPTPAHKFHTFKKGETLRMISGEIYGSVRWVRDIMQANGIRDPKSIKPGTKLRMP